jgi:YggT family protein
MSLITQILHLFLNLYLWVVIAFVAMSWLIAFGVLNTGNPQAAKLVELLQKLTDPVMKPIQKFVPPIAGIDLSPIILIIGIEIAKYIVVSIFG